VIKKLRRVAKKKKSGTVICIVIQGLGGCITLQALRSIIDLAPEHRFLCIILDNSILSESCFIFSRDQSVSFLFVGAGGGYFSTLPFMLYRARIYAFLAVRGFVVVHHSPLHSDSRPFHSSYALVMYFGSEHV
jgi:hypothetical protein